MVSVQTVTSAPAMDSEMSASCFRQQLRRYEGRLVIGAPVKPVHPDMLSRQESRLPEYCHHKRHTQSLASQSASRSNNRANSEAP